MSLSRNPAFSRLKQRYVCGYRDITNEPYAGHSGSHTPDAGSTDTTNGSGNRNLQLFVLAPDGTVLHALPGYWNPNDLVRELDLAEQLGGVWRGGGDFAHKQDEFHRLQLAHTAEHPEYMARRSEIQGFDRGTEERRNETALAAGQTQNPSTVDDGAEGGPKLKTMDVILHERMAVRPFLPYDEFDVADFVDIGGQFYDKHADNERSVEARVAARRQGDGDDAAGGAGSGTARGPRLTATNTTARMAVAGANAGGAAVAGSRLKGCAPPPGLVAKRPAPPPTARFELVAVAGGGADFSAVLRYRNQVYTVVPGDAVPDEANPVLKVQSITLDRVVVKVVATDQLVTRMIDEVSAGGGR